MAVRITDRTKAGPTSSAGTPLQALRLAAVALGLAALAGCGAVYDDGGAGYAGENGDDPEQLTRAAADGMIKILYRGQIRIAERSGGLVFLEGDIEVAPQELQVITDPGGEVGEVGARRQAVRIQGAGYRWPGGVVPFELDSSLSAAQQNRISNAMDDWEDAVPGLRFVARTAANAASYPDYVRFILSTRCSSSVGRVTGQQTIRLTNGCTTSFSVHHEIGHAIGLYHTHTRKDRDTYVQINWGNIQGCPNMATQRSHCGTCTTTNAGSCGCTAAQVTAGTCDMAHNFDTNNARANLGSYDYDSLMHYSSDGFSKNGNDTITVLQNDPATGAPYAIGQRTHLSIWDVEGVRALYPVLRTRRVVFRDTGRRPVCFLEGRERDVASRHFLYHGAFPYVTSAPEGELDTAGLAEGDHTYTRCRVRSVFWAENYNYPNTTRTFDFDTYTESQIETHQSGRFTVRVLNRGLLGVLTAI
jgi:hypothetical protein